MAKVVVSPVTNSANLSNINNNFDVLTAALNNGVLWRNNPVGEPNQISQDVDFNGNSALNIDTLDVVSLTVNGIDVTGAASSAAASAAAAFASATAANNAANAAAASAGQASAVLSSAALRANNLSDLTDAPTARANIGLGNVDNTSDVNKPVSTAQQTALNLKANLAGPTIFTGVISGPTPATSDNSTTYASTAYVKAQFAGSSVTPVFGATQVTGLLTVSSTSGIAGTPTNNNANAGSIGEYVTNIATGTSLTTSTAANAVSVSLTAGDWDVQGVCTFNPAGTTTVSAISAAINTVSATNPSVNTGARNLIQATLTTGLTQYYASPVFRISLSATTTVYLVATAGFGTSTMTVDGFIRARRVR